MNFKAGTLETHSTFLMLDILINSGGRGGHFLVENPLLELVVLKHTHTHTAIIITVNNGKAESVTLTMHLAASAGTLVFPTISSSKWNPASSWLAASSL